MPAQEVERSLCTFDIEIAEEACHPKYHLANRGERLLLGYTSSTIFMIFSREVMKLPAYWTLLIQSSSM
jgi:hypothetical protein